MINRPYSSVFIEEGGWTRYKQIPRTNSVNLANNCSKKLKTLIGSTRADHPDRGPSSPRARLSGRHFGAQHIELQPKNSFKHLKFSTLFESCFHIRFQTLLQLI